MSNEYRHQDARNIARIIQEHGPDYASTEHGDMTAPLLESLARLVEAAKAADRLAALDAARHAYASEFPLNAEGEPDVGNIHQNIRALKQRLATLEAENQRLQDALLDIKELVDTGGWYSATAGSVAEKALAGEGGDA